MLFRSPDKIYKNDKLYFNGSAMVVWPAGIFHRIISGEEGSISVNFATRTKKFDLKDNFNIYNLCTTTGDYQILRDGTDDQPDFTYKYPNDKIKNLFKDYSSIAPLSGLILISLEYSIKQCKSHGIFDLSCPVILNERGTLFDSFNLRLRGTTMTP